MGRKEGIGEQQEILGQTLFTKLHTLDVHVRKSMALWEVDNIYI